MTWCKISYNKKVLLRERKTHTARRVVSARYAALSNVWVGGDTPYPGYPPPSRPGLGSPPHPRPGMGYPSPSRPGWGSPNLQGTPNLGWGTPPTIQTWPQYPHPTPDLGWGTPHLEWGTPQPDLGWGTPLPASVNRLKILPSPILRMWAVTRKSSMVTATCALSMA